MRWHSNDVVVCARLGLVRWHGNAVVVLLEVVRFTDHAEFVAAE